MKKGFTLIELLVSVAIIGIIAAIAMANMQEYRRKANDVVAISDLKNAYTAMTTFYINLPIITPTGVSCTISSKLVQSPVGGYTCTQLLPGFTKSKGTAIYVQGDVNQPVSVRAAHCMGTQNVSYGSSNKQYTFNTNGTITSTYNTSDALNMSNTGSDCP